MIDAKVLKGVANIFGSKDEDITVTVENGKVVINGKHLNITLSLQAFDELKDFVNEEVEKVLCVKYVDEPAWWGYDCPCWTLTIRTPAEKQAKQHE